MRYAIGVECRTCHNEQYFERELPPPTEWTDEDVQRVVDALPDCSSCGDQDWCPPFSKEPA